MLFIAGCSQTDKLTLCGLNISQWAQKTDQGFIFTAGKSYVGRRTAYTGERHLWGSQQSGQYDVSEISDFFNGVDWGKTVDFTYEDLENQLYYYQAGITGLDDITNNDGVSVIFYDNFTRAVAMRTGVSKLLNDVTGIAYTVKNPEYVKAFFVDKNLYLKEDTILCDEDIAPWIASCVLTDDRDWIAVSARINNESVAGNKYLYGSWKRTGHKSADNINLLSAIKTEATPTSHNFFEDEICYQFTLATYSENILSQDESLIYCISGDFEYITVTKGYKSYQKYKDIDFPSKVWKITNTEEIKQLADDYEISLKPMAERSQITGADGPCGVDTSWWLDNFQTKAVTTRSRIHFAALSNDLVYYEDDKRTVGGKGNQIVDLEEYLPALINFSTTDCIPFNKELVAKDDYRYYMTFQLPYLIDNKPKTVNEITFMFFDNFKYVVVSDKPVDLFNSDIKYLVSDIYKVSNPQQIKDCFVARECFIW